MADGVYQDENTAEQSSVRNLHAPIHFDYRRTQVHCGDDGISVIIPGLDGDAYWNHAQGRHSVSRDSIGEIISLQFCPMQPRIKLQPHLPHGIPKTSRLIYLTPHTSHLAPHTSHLTPHTSHSSPHTSHLTHLTLHITHHTSHLTHYTSHVTRHTSHLTRHTSHVTPHTSHATPHTSHVTPHTSHLTPHTSHLTPHTSPARCGAKG